MTAKNVRVIFDTNVWISFLIGKRLSNMKEYISNGDITVIVTPQLLVELVEVTSRKKLRKHFPKESVIELIGLIKAIGEVVDIKPIHFINRDPKDNFLLDLIDYSKADYLVTGDKDLLEHNPFKTAMIISPADFEKVITKRG